jgi:hypothetical protein
MTGYTEEEICEVYKRKGWTSHFAGQVIADLRKGREHVHDFADTDTVTVRELREAWKRCGIDTPFRADGMTEMENFLRDIREHREPEYPAASVWKDHAGRIWFRTSDKRWMRFGKAEIFPHDRPVRPLKRMREVP